MSRQVKSPPTLWPKRITQNGAGFASERDTRGFTEAGNAEQAKVTAVHEIRKIQKATLFVP